MTRVRHGYLPLALAGLLIGVVPIRAAFETAIQVAQPIGTADGIVVSSVTYTSVMGHFPPGHAVALTTSRSCVATPSGDCENRNLANLHGFVAGADPHHSLTMSLFGDTLRVFVDASGIDEDARPMGWSPTLVAKATVDATIINAWRTRKAYDPRLGTGTAARFIHVEIRGPSRYSHLGGVYNAEAVAAVLSRHGYEMFKSAD